MIFGTQKPELGIYSLNVADIFYDQSNLDPIQILLKEIKLTIVATNTLLCSLKGCTVIPHLTTLFALCRSLVKWSRQLFICNSEALLCVCLFSFFPENVCKKKSGNMTPIRGYCKSEASWYKAIVRWGMTVLYFIFDQNEVSFWLFALLYEHELNIVKIAAHLFEAVWRISQNKLHFQMKNFTQCTHTHTHTHIKWFIAKNCSVAVLTCGYTRKSLYLQWFSTFFKLRNLWNMTFSGT